MGKFFDELKRRNVVRVGIAYVVVCDDTHVVSSLRDVAGIISGRAPS